jgi:hypothetical protein
MSRRRSPRHDGHGADGHREHGVTEDPSGLTSQGNDAGCDPCNGAWYLVVTAAYTLPDSYAGEWPAQDPDGWCTRSSDHRTLNCQRTSRADVF